MQRMLSVMLIIIWTLLQQNKIIDANMMSGDRCYTKDQIGECKERSQCPIITTLIKNGQYTGQEVVNCGFIVAEELICCPISKATSMTPNMAPSQQRTNHGERPAARACRRIEDDLPRIPTDRFHITTNTLAVIGEFSHMAAIGYRSQPYQILCGGSLIDKCFIMTAAHCFETHDYDAIIVRLGVVDFNDAEQLSRAVEIKIKNITEHPEYNIRYKYNDNAIVELERDVETSEFIHPVCLYINETDADPKTELLVTGWGHKKSISNANQSNSLMKASLYITPMDHCNRRFIEHSYTIPIPHGITGGIFCAENMKEGIDACQGDSGGPLNLVVNEKLKN